MNESHTDADAAPEADAATHVPREGNPAATSEPAAPAAPAAEIDPATQALIEDAARAASRKANKEAESLRKRLKAFEEAEAKRAEAELSEAERLAKQRDEAMAEAERLREHAAQVRIRAELEKAARAAGYNDESDALQLAAQIELDGDGNPIGVADAVQELLTAKPHYAARPAAPTLDPTNGGRSEQPALTPQQQTAQLMAGRRGPSIWAKSP